MTDSSTKGDPYNQYTYDDLDRLTAVTYHDSDTEAFNMDALGNRTGDQTLRDDGTVNFTVDDDTNRYNAIGGNNISHDDAGNLTVDKEGYQYSYDYENRVVKIEDVNDVAVATYAYDALGRRIRKIDSIADETTLYYYNPEWQVLAEYDDANSLQRYFVYGNYIDEPLVMNDGTDDHYYVQDHLYSTVALIGYGGSTWDVIERYEYDAYGKMTRLNPDFTAWSGTEAGNPYYFTGRRLDVLDSGNLPLMYYRHRCYDTYAGRFVQYDPLGYVDGMSLYEYVLSSPGNYFDPFGFFIETSAEFVVDGSEVDIYQSGYTSVVFSGLVVTTNTSRSHDAGTLTTIQSAGMQGIQTANGIVVGYEQAAWWLTNSHIRHSARAWRAFVRAHDASQTCGMSAGEFFPMKKALDVTRHLSKVLTDIGAFYGGKSPSEKCKLCKRAFSWYSLGRGSRRSWDIDFLYDRSSGGMKEPGRSVIVNDKCYDAAAVNYAMYGLMGRLCDRDCSYKPGGLGGVMSRVKKWKQVYYGVTVDPETEAWVIAGYAGWTIGTGVYSFTPYHVPEKKFRGSPEKAFDFAWLPYKK